MGRGRKATNIFVYVGLGLLVLFLIVGIAAKKFM
ncbi:hypothetical protein JTE87_04311 [Bacillus amyloliquefaciens]|nr:hypothetical protein [Bacillus subtilis]MCB5337307.1 hypothetical protein [Bacillus amyloliquefaciens]